MTEAWKKAQEWEKDWHGDFVNSINEELKQVVYAHKMGLTFTPTPKTPYNLDLEGKSVIDIGGGGYSLFLKCSNFSKATVVDPILPPEWVLDRYEAHNVDFMNIPAEDFRPDIVDFPVDEIWIYNCLQHTIDPEKIIANARKVGKLIRIFEWIETSVNVGHIHTLKAEKLNEWLGGEGKVENIKEHGCAGLCYYGVFPT